MRALIFRWPSHIKRKTMAEPLLICGNYIFRCGRATSSIKTVAEPLLTAKTKKKIFVTTVAEPLRL